jgi:hypothetical protein
MSRLIALLALGLIFVGCSDPADQLEQVQKTTRSWSATIYLAAENFQNSSVTQTYLHQTLDQADHDLSKASEDLSDIKLPDDRKRKPADDLSALRKRIPEMQDALTLKRFDRFIALAHSLPRDGSPATHPGGAP